MLRGPKGICAAAALLNSIYDVRGRFAEQFYCANPLIMCPVLENLLHMPELLHQIKTLVPDHFYIRVQMQALNEA